MNRTHKIVVGLCLLFVIVACSVTKTNSYADEPNSVTLVGQTPNLSIYKLRDGDTSCYITEGIGYTTVGMGSIEHFALSDIWCTK